MNINTIWLTTNRSCNNKCSWCYAQNNSSNSAIMDFSSACRIVDMASEVHVKKIILIGGEPTLYENLIDLVRYIRSKDIDVWIATNGRLLSNMSFSKRLVEAGADKFDLSLKGTSEEEYKELTNSSGFTEFLNGYRNLVAIGKHPNASYVIVNDSILTIDRLIDIIQTYEIRSFTFQFVKPVIQSMSNPIMPLPSMGKVLVYIYNKMKSLDVNCQYRFEVSFPLCMIDEDILVDLIKSECISTCCHIQSGKGLIFDTRLHVLPCNHFVDLPFSDETFESCTIAQIDSFLNSAPVVKFRGVTKRYPAKKCSSCKLWDKCGGGCFTRWLYLNPEKEILGFSDDGLSVIQGISF